MSSKARRGAATLWSRQRSGRFPWRSVVVFALSMSTFVSLPAEAANRGAPPPVIISTTLPSATQGSAYVTVLVASGGTPPYTWSLLTGPVPLGLVLSSSGTISGVPGSSGATSIILRVTDANGLSGTATVSLSVQSAPVPPQQIVTVTSRGLATLLGTAYATPSVDPIPASAAVGVSASPTGKGSWVLTSAGRVIPIGGVRVYGEIPRSRARNGAVGIASNATGTGYWVVTKFGHVYGFGAARAKGSLVGLTRRDEVVGITRSQGNGYYLIQATGRVTGFGSAVSLGSVHARRQHVRIAGIVSMVAGKGYWVVTTSGRIYSFGDAKTYHLSGPPPTGAVVGIATATTGIGFYLLESSGAVLSYGAALQLAPEPVASEGVAVGISAAV